jgi:hypothetical protein
MRRPLFFACLLAVFCVVSCTNNAQESKTKNSALVVSSNDIVSEDDAGFSCKLDGKEFSGKGTDQNINAAFHLTGENKGQIMIRLSPLDKPEEKLIFQVTGKEGSTTFNVTPTYRYTGYTTKGYINYLDNPITVTIALLTATKVSGTFSGTYTLSKASSDSNAKQTIEVTDGKFDIPFSNSADWKKMYQAE